MASVASQLIEEVTAHAQSDSLEGAREICADGTYFPNNLRTFLAIHNMQPTKRSIIFFLRYHIKNMVLRRIFGPKRDEVTGEWRKLRTETLHDP